MHRDDGITFNPNDYWQQRGETYDVGTDNIRGELNILAKFLTGAKPKRLLEVGSGWGRIYSALAGRGVLEGIEYQMVDFVLSMREHCREATGILPDEWDGLTLPYADDRFDIVLSWDVLLHVLPDDIGRVFSEHVRVSSRWLYIATSGLVYGELAEHCFWHDYLRLFSAHELHVEAVNVWKRGRRFHWIMKK